MPTKKAEEKAVKRIGEGYRRAVHKGVPETAVERAVDKGIERGTRNKSATAGEVGKGAKAHGAIPPE